MVLGAVVDAGKDVWTFDVFVLGDVEDLVGLLEIPGSLFGIKGEMLTIEVHVSGENDVTFFLDGEYDTLVIVESWVNCFIGGVICPFLSDVGVVSLLNENAVGSSGFWSKCILTNCDSHLLVTLGNQMEARSFLNTSWIKSFNLRESVKSLLAANKLEFIFEVAHVAVNLWRAAHMGDLAWAHLLEGNVPAFGNLVVTDLEKVVFAVAFLCTFNVPRILDKLSVLIGFVVDGSPIMKLASFTLTFLKGLKLDKSDGVLKS